MTGRLALASRLARSTAHAVGRAGLVVGTVVLLLVAVGPRTGRYQVLTVLSDSMRPTMAPGAVLVVVPVRPADIGVGDVITFRAPVADQHVVTHRVIEVVEGGEHPTVRTQGDANDAPDPWVAKIEDERAWRAAAVIPRAGYGILLLRQATPRVLLSVVAPILLVVAWLGLIWSPPRADRPPELPGAGAAG